MMGLQWQCYRKHQDECNRHLKPAARNWQAVFGRKEF
jgi:hypothetical protein